ncbi:hypothetical protein DPS63_05570 [Salmonella enterica subsp. enterica serovar Heidelberg]|nr:hypothetical protein [Salmonella enterica subsp. enterica serovar Heidelberg]
MCVASKLMWHGGNLKLSTVRRECSNRRTKLLN